MKRREFIAIAGGFAAGWPLVTHAQQPAIPVVGFLDSRSPGEDASGALAFQKGLGDAGFVEGHNVKLDFRWAEGQYDRLPALVADLIRHRSCIA